VCRPVRVIVTVLVAMPVGMDAELGVRA
jgi:hypothetical protein